MIPVDDEYTTVFRLCTYSEEIIDVFSDLRKTFTLAFWQTLFKGDLSDFYVITTLLRVWEFMPGLMTLTLF